MSKKWLLPGGLSAFLSVTLLFFGITHGSSSYSPDNSSGVDIEKAERYDAGLKAIRALLEEFGEDGENINFPDDYGDKYFDEEGYLYILTTQENLDDISFLSDNPLIKDCVIYKYAPRSYNELKRLQDFLGIYMSNFNISTIGTMPSQNVIEVGLLDLQDKEAVLDLLRNKYEGFDESMVTFVQKDKMVLI